MTAEEMQSLSHFLQSPYFFDGRSLPSAVLALFHLLQQWHPSFPSAQVEKQAVYPQLFPGESPSKGKLEKVMSGLQKAVEQFIVVHYAPIHREIDQQKIMLRFYREKQLENGFRNGLKKFDKIQKKETKKGSNFYQYEFWKETEISQYAFLYNYNTRKEDLNLTNGIQSLDIYYFVLRLELVNKLLAQHKFQRPLFVETQQQLIRQLLPHIEEQQFFQTPLLELNAAVFSFLSEEKEEQYQKLLLLLGQYQKEIPDEQLKPLLTLCRNYCIRQYNRGKKGFLRKAFELYKDHLAQGYLHYEDGLLPRTVKTIMELGLRLKELDWAKQFLQDYKSSIVGTNHPEEVYRYNLAIYHFASGRFEEALSLLADTYEDTFYKIDARRLEIKIYYETQSVLLEARLNAFRILILRTSKGTLPELHRSGNDNFVKLLSQILHSATRGNAKRIDRLKERLQDKAVIADKHWLLEKLEEMK
ncbi:MAG: hypothetical protein AAFV95_22185 [Bacteroidota bacterium]